MTPIVNSLVAHRACFYIDDAKLGTRGSGSGRCLRDIAPLYSFFRGTPSPNKNDLLREVNYIHGKDGFAKIARNLRESRARCGSENNFVGLSK